MAKKTTSTPLDGINNQLGHQLIITDLIYGIRKIILKSNKIVIPEISLQSISNVDTNYNVDICVTDKNNPNNCEVIIEIENKDNIRAETKEKINYCFTHIKSLIEFFIIEWNNDKEIRVSRYIRTTTNKGKKDSNEKSEVLNYSLSSKLYIFKKTNLQ